MNKILVWILIPLSLVCSWALWRCTQERNQCRANLLIQQHNPAPLALGILESNGDYAPFLINEKNYVYAKCASPEAIADMERKQIAVFNCKCEGEE